MAHRQVTAAVGLRRNQPNIESGTSAVLHIDPIVPRLCYM